MEGWISKIHNSLEILNRETLVEVVKEPKILVDQNMEGKTSAQPPPKRFNQDGGR
jgi:hypothetical protein